MPQVRSGRINMVQKRILASRWLCQALNNRYHWGYKETKPDGR